MSDRYALWDSCPNNAVTRCWGIYDLERDDYVDHPEHGFCYGLTLREAEKALTAVNAGEEEVSP